MKTIAQIITFTLVLSTSTLFAQKKVALHSSGSTSFFTGASPYTDAYNAAVDGDTIYIPGGTFASPGNINKRIVVYGIGHHPDSSAVMGETIITGNTSIQSGAAKSHFEGLKFSTGYFQYSGVADSIVVKRCHLTTIRFNNHASVGTQIIENVIVESINGAGSINTVIANNIIKKAGNGLLSSFANQAWIRNNIIVGTGSTVNYNARYIMGEIVDCLFDNNIIFNEGSGASFRIEHVLSPSVSNNTFKNNVFNITPDLALHTEENNYFNVASSNFFNNYTGLVFDYAEDLHLTDPTSYAGTTGNEVGIYGGFTPAKVGMIPVNPHFQFKSIAPATDANGDLQIQIKVEAQNE